MIWLQRYVILSIRPNKTPIFLYKVLILLFWDKFLLTILFLMKNTQNVWQFGRFCLTLPAILNKNVNIKI